MNEMNILREALTAKGIDWHDKSDELFTRTHFIRPSDGVPCSVVYGRYSYGGSSGLLESMPPVHFDDEDDVEGYLTAEDIIATWL